MSLSCLRPDKNLRKPSWSITYAQLSTTWRSSKTSLRTWTLRRRLRRPSMRRPRSRSATSRWPTKGSRVTKSTPAGKSDGRSAGSRRPRNWQLRCSKGRLQTGQPGSTRAICWTCPVSPPLLRSRAAWNVAKHTSAVVQVAWVAQRAECHWVAPLVTLASRSCPTCR